MARSSDEETTLRDAATARILNSPVVRAMKAGANRLMEEARANRAAIDAEDLKAVMAGADPMAVVAARAKLNAAKWAALEAGDTLSEPATRQRPEPMRVQFNDNEKAILVALLKADKPLTHGEEGGIERATSLEKSSVGRALNHLKELGLVVKAEGIHGFALTEPGEFRAREILSQQDR